MWVLNQMTSVLGGGRGRKTQREGVGKPEAETHGDTGIRDKEVRRPLPEIFQKSGPADALILNSRPLDLALWC